MGLKNSRPKGFAVILVVIFVVSIATTGYLLLRKAQLIDEIPVNLSKTPIKIIQKQLSGSIDASTPPTNLELPVRIDDIKTQSGLISPFGLIRHSKDAGLGHGGIDLPLVKDAPIIAVSDGKIISYEKATDGRGGYNLVLLITEAEVKGEGWAFLYEHITLETDLSAGSGVKRGQVIGKSAMEGKSNNHFQLTYAFNNLEFYKNHTCWIGQLVSEDQIEVNFWFDNEITTNYNFITGWQTATEEGMFLYRNLLDRNEFSQGPQLCYEFGTDARIPIN